MDENAPRVKTAEGLQSAVLAVDRHVAHAAAGFFARAGAQHFVVGKQRAVEQDRIGFAETLSHRRRHRRSTGHEHQPRAAALQFDADIGRAFGADFGVVALEIKRQLARHHE